MSVKVGSCRQKLVQFILLCFTVVIQVSVSQKGFDIHPVSNCYILIYLNTLTDPSSYRRGNGGQ